MGHHRGISRRDGVGIEKRLVAPFRLDDLFVKAVPMDEKDFVSLGGSRRQPFELARKRRVVEGTGHGVDPRRRFGMSLTGVVFLELLGENDACPHPLTCPRQLPAG